MSSNFFDIVQLYLKHSIMQVGAFAFVGIKSDTIVINKGEFF